MKQALGVLCLANEHPLSTDGGPIPWLESLPFPVVKRHVPGAWADQVLARNLSLRDAYAECARDLEGEGVVAIATDCGYAIAFQQAIRSAVQIPVAASSLQQLPFILNLMNPDEKLAIICFDARKLTPWHLSRAGVNATDPRVVIAGYENGSHYNEFIQPRPKVDIARVTADLVQIIEEVIRSNNGITHVFLECVAFIFSSDAIRKRFGLPTYDWVTLTKTLMSSVIDLKTSRTQRHFGLND